MSVNFTAAAASFLFSSAHCWIAPSTWRRLLMHALFCEVVRALMKLGMAIAANRPIMATTIMISTNVKPDWRVVQIGRASCRERVEGVDDAAAGINNLEFG